MEKIKKRKKSQARLRMLADAALLTLALLAAHFIKRGDVHIDPLTWKFIPLYFLSWLVSTWLSGKFKASWRKRRENGGSNRLGRVKPFAIGVLLFAVILSLILSHDRWNELSRIITFSSLVIYFGLEVILLTGIFVKQNRRREDVVLREFSIFFFLMEIFLILLGTYIIQAFGEGALKISDQKLVVMAVIFFVWMFIGLITHKFSTPTDRNYLRAVWPFVRSWFFILCVSVIMVFVFRLNDYTPLIMGVMAAFAFFELLVVTIYFLDNRPKEMDISPISLIQADLPERNQLVREVIEKERTDSKEYQIPNQAFQSRFLREKLMLRYLRRYPKLFNFIDHVMDLTTIDILNAEVIDSANPYNIEILEDNSLEFLLNLHQLNSFGRIDEYLIDVNQRLKENGFFISKFQPLEFRIQYFQKKYPPVLSHFLYALDVVWRQFFPKTPVLRKIYFTLSRGRSRVMSMAEGFGRLYFCGFEIVSLEEEDNYLYFIVKKAQDPYTWFRYFHNFDRMPSFGVFFKQKRIGKGKNYIYIYKMQTMYPYSEFIHQYVLELNNLDDSGKIKNDFRITRWGRLFRKIWLDELPMILNLFKGDIKLVGVRPLSETFFRTYPADLQHERTLYKPGLIPPYYADLPANMDGVLESERRYLERYKKAPLKTDWVYFWKAFYNIAFKGAKSG